MARISGYVQKSSGAGNKRRRRMQSGDHDSHKLTVQEYMELVEAEARNYGKVRISDWERDPFARDCFKIACDERMLKRAYESLKGEAAGTDQVTKEDFWRGRIYRKWAEHCGLFQRKRPAYMDTVFPTAPASHLMALHILLNPDHAYRMNAVQMKSTAGKRIDTKALPVEEFLAPLSDSGSKEKSNITLESYGRTHLPIQFTPRCAELMEPAGRDSDKLRELCDEVVASVKGMISAIAANAPIDRVASYTPFTHLYEAVETDITTPGKAVNALTWAAARSVQTIMLKSSRSRSKGFQPQPLRKVEITKPDGGLRTLNVATIVDRVAAKAVELTLSPMFDEIFLPCSVGFRMGKDRFDALSALSRAYPKSQGKFILCADIQKAFDEIRHDRLLDTIGRYIPNPDMREILRRFIHRKEFAPGVGIVQGCPLSPLFLNLLLHDALDRPLMAKLPQHILYLRYADDLCLFGFGSEDEGKRLQDTIQGTLTPIGMRLHTQAPKTQMANLSEGQNMTTGDGAVGIDKYLGIGLRGSADGTLAFTLPRGWQVDFAGMIYDAAENADSIPSVMRAAVTSWIDAMGPVWFKSASLREYAQEMAGIIRTHLSIEGQLDAKFLHDAMLIASGRWQRILNQNI